jgi:hypothetical protein
MSGNRFPSAAGQTMLDFIGVVHTCDGARRIGRSVLPACLMIVGWATTMRADIDFERDIRPILSQKCFRCHGPDADSRKADRRLDTRDGYLADNDGIRAVVPGKPGESELYQRITTDDKDDRMPPRKSNLSLSNREIELLKQWIEAGAPWAPHWSLRKLAKPDVRKLGAADEAWMRNDIDRFVLARLKEKGFKPSPETDKRTLIRRVTFDLIGLPPTPEEIEAFLADNSDKAYDRVVDQLLASPRYGERWARHWMDLVHYADTHGHDEDAIRENAWPYRDYLIESFNADKPYARFAQEQIAGDVLFPDDPKGIVAVGMLAAGPWDESSQMGIKDGTTDKIIAQYLERDDMIATVMNTFVSMTVHCARCHHHKFDPIPTEDYYSLQAVFAGVDRIDRPYDHDVATSKKRQAVMRRKGELESGTVSREMLLGADSVNRVAAWEKALDDRGGDWRVVRPDTIKSTGGATATKLDDGSILFGGKRPDKDVYTITTRVTQHRITAVRVEVLSDDSLLHKGPGRQDNGNLHLSEFRLLVDGKAVALHKPVADFNQNGWTIAHALDRNPKSAWGIYPQVGRSHEAIFRLTKPIDASSGETLTFVIEQLHGGGHLIGRPRLSVTGSGHPKLGVSIPAAISDILRIDANQRTDDQKAKLSFHVLKTENDGAITSLPKLAMVYSIATDFKKKGNFAPARKPRPVHVLRRGNVLMPIKPASPGALSCVEGIQSQFAIKDDNNEGQRRAALARWVSEHDNVLTWRSIVNRVWHYHFGRGIVATPSDFGRNGSPPTHPLLLDWLAVTFRDGGGSFKKLHRLIMTSATYRQSSQHNAEFAKTDRDNRYLWRMNRRRLDAESTRDAVLAMSGRMILKMGGPSDRQFSTGKGVHVTPTVNYDKFNIEGESARRRSVYRFIFRTVPDPLMEALDCPDASQFTPKRTASVTSLQALAMLNNRFIVRYCEHIANRIEQERRDRDAQIRRLFMLAYGRPPTKDESKSVAAYAAKHGLANACRVIVNTNEFMFVN